MPSDKTPPELRCICEWCGRSFLRSSLHGPRPRWESKACIAADQRSRAAGDSPELRAWKIARFKERRRKRETDVAA